jgi:hypothetical protein
LADLEGEELEDLGDDDDEFSVKKEEEEDVPDFTDTSIQDIAKLSRSSRYNSVMEV